MSADESASAGSLPEPRFLDSETVFRTPYFSIARDVFAAADSGARFDYYKLDRPDGTIMLGLTPAGEIILVRQFRPALRRFTLELPCGAVDPGESPLEAARREFYEETGYRCSFVPVGLGRIMMNRVAAREHCFFGRDAVRDPQFTPREPIEVRLHSPESFRALVAAGEFEQLATLGTILLAQWKGELKAF
jgi:8-oxo-dGTP pyrophosphatase MutT (NUDIX family)